MNKKQLQEFKNDLESVIVSREALGEYNADSKYMLYLLKNMRSLVQHAIDTYPKPPRDKTRFGAP